MLVERGMLMLGFWGVCDDGLLIRLKVVDREGEREDEETILEEVCALGCACDDGDLLICMYDC